MLVFIMIGLSTFVCNIGQGQCIFVDPQVMQGILAAGVIELIGEGMFGMFKVFRKKDDDNNSDK
jgi:hypothetical protein